MNKEQANVLREQIRTDHRIQRVPVVMSGSHPATYVVGVTVGDVDQTFMVFSSPEEWESFSRRHFQQEAGPPPPSRQERWEYQIFTLDIDKPEDAVVLNELGREGWKVVGSHAVSYPRWMVWHLFLERRLA